MLIRPKQLGTETISTDILAEDKKHCRKFGPCGVGEEALYLNSFYFDRVYYLPIRSVKRIYKRVAMSRGGFTGRGLFASVPYLVVEYDNGKEKQCNFKFEEKVDQMIEWVHSRHPEIPTASKEAEKKLKEKQLALEAKKKKLEKAAAREDIRKLQESQAYLEKRSSLYQDLSRTAHQKRVNDRSNPAYRWVALFIVLMGAAAALYGLWNLLQGTGGAVYFLLFGLAAIFLFSGANVLPTRRNNSRAVQKELEEAVGHMESYVKAFPADFPFPVPARYAHPQVLAWMQDILADRRAEDIPGALEVLKDDLKKLNADVTVEQETYEAVMAIKPLFLVNEYR